MHEELFERIYETVAKKENTYDGVYYTCVRTTKIFCRPSCRARTPLPKNVLFVSSADEAVKAGFRPCKRCKPDVPGRQNPDERMAAEVNKLLESQLDRALTLSSMAEKLAISPFHLQRLYKRVTGMTPAARLQQLRLEAAQARLSQLDGEENTGDTIASIAKAVGFRSHSHFSSWFCRETGMTPREYREIQIAGRKEQ